MNWLEQVLSPALVRALGWTLVHSLWQGAVVALALAGLLLLLRRHRAAVRYNVSAVALIVMLGLAAVTFARHYHAARTQAAPAAVSTADTITGHTLELAAAPAMATAAPAGSMQAWLNYFDQNLPVLVAVWLLGLLAMTLRLLGGLAYVQRLRHYRVQPLAEEWQQRLAGLATRAGLERPVALLESALVKAPLVVGHLRPVILLPLGTATGLSQLYLEAILAHELAHVARRDYLMNLLQAIAETLFFYHPAVWFLSACLRTERENCCDDDATALVGGNPLTLARALAALAERTLEPQAAPRLAMSAIGPNGSLLGRIRRLVQGRGTPTFTEGFMAACVVLGGMVLLSTAVALADPQPVAEENNLKGSLQRLPFLTEDDTARSPQPAAAVQPAPAAPPAPDLMPKELAVAEPVDATAAPSADDDKKRKAKRSRTERVVVVNQNGPRRGGPGTVVIEKDKKGRLTDLYVNGRRVEGATAAPKKKGKKTDTRTEVIRVNPEGWNGTDGRGFSFNFGDDFGRNFRFEGSPGISREEMDRIRRDVRVQVDAARRQTNRNYTFSFRNEDGGRESYGDIERRALQQAEQSLREAERNAKTDEERTRIREERERITERRQELREQQEEARRDMDEAHRDMEEAHREMEEAHREGLRVAAESRRAAGEARRAAAGSRVLQDAFVAEMLRDKLITDRSNFSFSLRSNSLTVNGKKQPAAVLNKYLKLYEQRKGQKLSSTGGFTINESSSSSTSTSSSTDLPPVPPVPPVAPAPRAPRAPRMPLAPPAPPAPPRIDSGRIREELRKDGLLGKDEKSFQFQLNDSGLRVNGQAQSAEMAAKYRKLLDVPANTSGSRSNRNIQISVSE
ncbi:M56 family metallopeptidase [Hymenobacter psychrotolerans]|uniref:Signal transducer regulating beta-lactamase production, contains metallopeptidase domain n=1 Tax=Hymenobacter psychrotolerans DSM 18569 TaxID=1121959 RepID=A0A1M6TQ49_9BACT|nr:M56 family metallopeptidase [Hymenobacter psychrotolerans]SHK59040.1 Signal transducer regulating beta-lactamase production, contains metallopeptidase domain [Hymenobacter psychrotolerans DSM 18569]